jgi:hypothetical protein
MPRPIMTHGWGVVGWGLGSRVFAEASAFVKRKKVKSNQR